MADLTSGAARAAGFETSIEDFFQNNFLYTLVSATQREHIWSARLGSRAQSYHRSICNPFETKIILRGSLHCGVPVVLQFIQELT